MKNKSDRRSFLKSLGVSGTAATFFPVGIFTPDTENNTKVDHRGLKEENKSRRNYNDHYTNNYLNRVAFPMGGMGAGMICLEGTGALSHVSIKNKPEIFNEPGIFAAIAVKGLAIGAKVLEGPVPDWK